MNVIPKDVMASAIRALSVPEYDMVTSVSAAILAERKQCVRYFYLAGMSREDLAVLRHEDEFMCLRAIYKTD